MSRSTDSGSCSAKSTSASVPAGIKRSVPNAARPAITAWGDSNSSSRGAGSSPRRWASVT